MVGKKPIFVVYLVVFMRLNFAVYQVILISLCSFDIGMVAKWSEVLIVVPWLLMV